MTLQNPIDRDIIRLALPALGALVAEPLFLLTDTALVGHLGADALAGLGIASTVLQTIIGLLVFLAYATTPTVARRLGAGDRPGAIRAGIDGMWLALAIGVALVAAGVALTEPLARAFAPSEAVADAAATYLGISLWGIPGMLLVIAATGLLRGLQDTRMPLVVALIGFAANAGVNAVLIYGLGLGIAGSALGTIIAQWGMAAVYMVFAVRAARTVGVGIRPGFAGVSTAAVSGGWLLVRTASLRAAIVLTVWAGARVGVVELATLQISLTIFFLLALVLDAFAIAGQALIGHGLGASDVDRVRRVTLRLLRFSILSGVVIGIVVAVISPVAGVVFSSDPEVRALLAPALVVMAIGTPLAGFVFVLDGVLIGAGDARYLAWTGIVNLAAYLPLLWLATQQDASTGLIALQAAFSLGYLGARAITLGLRARTDRWIVVGT